MTKNEIQQQIEIIDILSDRKIKITPAGGYFLPLHVGIEVEIDAGKWHTANTEQRKELLREAVIEREEQGDDLFDHNDWDDALEINDWEVING